MRGRAIIQVWRRLIRARRGATAVEFALLLPALLMLYLGGYELTQALSTYRKLTDTTTELASIVSQYTTMSASDVSGVFGATSQIMAPNSTSSLGVVLSIISTDANKTATVTWSQAYNNSLPLTAGSAVTLPSAMVQASSSYILVQTTYQYTPTLGAAYIPSIPLSSKIYMVPRQSSTIAYTG